MDPLWVLHVDVLVLQLAVLLQDHTSLLHQPGFLLARTSTFRTAKIRCMGLLLLLAFSVDNFGPIRILH